MGSCVSSSHMKSTTSTPDSPIKLLPSSIPLPDQQTIHTTTSSSSPLKNAFITPIHNTNSSILSPHRDSSGNNEETMFFDSRGWLDSISDCEDDFMSVDGEFTPSRGTTPVHHKFCDQTHRADDAEKHEEEPSPTDNKKRLLELFKETQDEEDDDDDEEEDVVAKGKARACLWLRTPVRSSAPTTPHSNFRERQQERLKRVRSAAHSGCVPRLVTCSSFTERRRKMMSRSPVDVRR